MGHGYTGDGTPAGAFSGDGAEDIDLGRVEEKSRFSDDEKWRRIGNSDSYVRYPASKVSVDTLALVAAIDRLSELLGLLVTQLDRGRTDVGNRHESSSQVAGVDVAPSTVPANILAGTPDTSFQRAGESGEAADPASPLTTDETSILSTTGALAASPNADAVPPVSGAPVPTPAAEGSA